MAPQTAEINTDFISPSHPQLGKPHQVWPYTLADGRPFCSVARWNLPGGKADDRAKWLMHRKRLLSDLFRVVNRRIV